MVMTSTTSSKDRDYWLIHRYWTLKDVIEERFGESVIMELMDEVDRRMVK